MNSPVRITARLGAQIEFVTNALSNRIPPAAIRSMFGVTFRFDPYALIACAPWSSVKMNTMFGRDGPAAASPSST